MMASEQENGGVLDDLVVDDHLVDEHVVQGSLVRAFRTLAERVEAELSGGVATARNPRVLGTFFAGVAAWQLAYLRGRGTPWADVTTPPIHLATARPTTVNNGSDSAATLPPPDDAALLPSPPDDAAFLVPPVISLETSDDVVPALANLASSSQEPQEPINDGPSERKHGNYLWARVDEYDLADDDLTDEHIYNAPWSKYNREKMNRAYGVVRCGSTRQISSPVWRLQRREFVVA